MHSRDNADSEYVLYVRQTIRVRSLSVTKYTHSLIYSHILSLLY